MRARLLLGWLVGAVLVVGCETNQPALLQEQSISLTFSATGANVQEMWLWRVYEDSGPVPDGVPDDSTGDGEPDEYLWCDPQPTYVGSSMPWSFSVQVDVISQGSTQPLTIARETEPNSSFASYDPSTGSNAPTNKPNLLVTNRTGFCRFDPNILCNPDNLPTVDPPTTICEIEGAGTCIASGVCSGDSSVTCAPDSGQDTCQDQGLGSCNNLLVTRRFVFEPVATAVSGASQLTLAAATNIVYVTDPTAANSQGPTGGRCPGQDLGPANIDGNPTPWTFVIQRGDTVNVQARRFSDVPPGFARTTGPAPIDPSIVYFDDAADPLSARTEVDGSQVGVIGSTTTTVGDLGSFIDYYFTSN